MLHEIISLTPDSRLHAYVGDLHPEASPRMGLLVIPGGGYSFLATGREGEAVALRFSGMGYNCFILEYSVGEGAKFPTPLRQAALAMAYIRENARRYRLDPDRIFALGFSAGGHLCGALGSFWHREDLTGVPAELAKPRGTVLIYPVITGGIYRHNGSFCRICGCEEPTQEQRDAWSMENQVSEYTVPAFLAHTAADKTAPVENTLLMAGSLAKQKIPFEVHIFSRGKHGMALGDETTYRDETDLCPEFARWPELAADWMKRMGETV